MARSSSMHSSLVSKPCKTREIRTNCEGEPEQANNKTQSARNDVNVSSQMKDLLHVYVSTTIMHKRSTLNHGKKWEFHDAVGDMPYN